MTNEMKLMMALCDALGFDVETIDTSMKFYKPEHIDMNGKPYSNGVPTVIPSTDYKLTKRKISPAKTGGLTGGDI